MSRVLNRCFCCLSCMVRCDLRRSHTTLASSAHRLWIFLHVVCHLQLSNGMGDGSKDHIEWPRQVRNLKGRALTLILGRRSVDRGCDLSGIFTFDRDTRVPGSGPTHRAYAFLYSDTWGIEVLKGPGQHRGMYARVNICGRLSSSFFERGSSFLVVSGPSTQSSGSSPILFGHQDEPKALQASTGMNCSPIIATTSIASIRAL